VIPTVPLNAALFVADLSQPVGEIIGVGSAGERHNCFDVRDAVEAIECGGEHFCCIGRSNQRIWFVGASKEVAGEDVDSASGRTITLYFR